jgi:hypothetical protein
MGFIEVKQYTSADEMLKAHTATRARLMGKPQKPVNVYGESITDEPAIEPPKVYIQPKVWNVPYDCHVYAWRIADYQRRVKSLEMSLRNKTNELDRILGRDVECPPLPRARPLDVVKDTLAKCALEGLGSYTLEEIRSPRRNRQIIKVRHRCIAEVADKCRHMSYPQMGMFFNREHTSILHAARKMGVQR